MHSISAVTALSVLFTIWNTHGIGRPIPAAGGNSTVTTPFFAVYVSPLNTTDTSPAIFIVIPFNIP